MRDLSLSHPPLSQSRGMGTGRLAFVGEKARTFMLSPVGRGWLSTGRAAEPHPVDPVVEHRRDGESELEGSWFRITTTSGGIQT